MTPQKCAGMMALCENLSTHSLMVRTLPFQGGSRGSIPRGCTNFAHVFRHNMRYARLFRKMRLFFDTFMLW